MGANAKFRADVLEALLGELHILLWSIEPMHPTVERFVDVPGLGEGRAPLATIVQHVLSEIFDVVVLSLLRSYADRVVPLLHEAALVGRFFTRRPVLQADRRRAPLQTRRMATVQPLPAKASIERAPRAAPQYTHALFRPRTIGRTVVGDAALTFFNRHCRDPMDAALCGDVPPSLQPAAAAPPPVEGAACGAAEQLAVPWSFAAVSTAAAAVVEVAAVVPVLA